MKKFVNLCLICIVIPAAAFFASCDSGGGDSGGKVTYRVTVGNISEYPGTEVTITPVLKASNGGTSGIAVEFTCSDASPPFTIDENKITIQDTAAPGVYNFTAAAKKAGKSVATTTFTITVKDPGDFAVGSITIDDMTIFRFGGTAESRTIDFILYDSGGGKVESSLFRDLVGIEIIDSGDLEIVEDDGKLIIKEDKTLNPYEYTVEIKVTYNGVLQSEPTDFKVTVEKYMLDVNFYNGAEKLIDLTDEIEYGGKVNDPGDPDLPDLNFYGWYAASSFADKFDFDTPITATADIYGRFLSSTAVDYSLTITAAIGSGPEAALKPGEYVWIAGDFYDQSNGALWSKHLLAKQTDGTWTVTIDNIPIAHTSIDYNIYAVSSNQEAQFSWDISAADDDITFDDPISGVLNYTVTEWFGRVDDYDLSITVTIGSELEAALKPGEYVWVEGNFYNVSSWTAYLLTEQTDGTWTTTLNNIPGFATIKYNVYADKSNSALSWSIKAHDVDMTYNYNDAPGTLDYTVTKWLGRPNIVAGNLLANANFVENKSTSWSIADGIIWTITGLNTSPSSVYFTGDPPGAKSEGICLSDYKWGASNSSYYLDNNATLTITQPVDASINGLAADVDVTLSVWINQLNKEQKDVILLVGAQEYDVTADLTGAAYSWQQVSQTFTLTETDIVGDKITVGLQYTAATATCMTYIDDFSLVIAD